MSPPRTLSRLKNEHLFYGVDWVVYIEGGPEAAAASGDEPVLDLRFWEMIFGLYQQHDRFRFKPLGGKPELFPIAAMLAQGELDTTLVCMDRDYDHLTGLLAAPGILYTHGYSWENDVWSGELIEDLFYSFCPVPRQTVVVRPTIDYSLEALRRDTRWAIVADALGKMYGATVIPRNNFRCVVVREGQEPHFDRSYLLHCVHSANMARQAQGLRLPDDVDIDPMHDLFGHLLAYFCFHLLFFLTRLHCGGTLRKDYTYAIAIRLAADHVRQNRALNAHYERQFAQWRAART